MKNFSFKSIAIMIAITLGLYGLSTFAYTTIDTSIFNAVQIIMRTIYTDNGSASGNIVAQINNLSGVSYFLQPVGVQTNNPNANLQVVGNVTFGDKDNFAGYPNDSQFNSVLGGLGNHVETTRSSIAGGVNNNIVADAAHSFIGGGGFNTIHSRASVINGGEYNTINNGYATAYAVIAGGRNNSINGELSTIGGGGYHSITNSFATIAGGYQNGVNGNYGTVAGGKNNVVGNDSYAGFIGGGDQNTLDINANLSTIVAGQQNTIQGANNFIGGGLQNTIGVTHISSIVGGQLNTIQSANGFIGGGEKNGIYGDFGSIAGGKSNEIRSRGVGGVIPGGELNVVDGEDSFAGGKGAYSVHHNTFVWSDGTMMPSDPSCSTPAVIFACMIQVGCPVQCQNAGSPFESTANNQFLIYASNGVGINTNTPGASLQVSGNVMIDVIPQLGTLNGTTPVLVQGPNNEVQYVQASQLGGGGFSPWEVGAGLHSIQVIGDGTNQASGDYSTVAGRNNLINNGVGSSILGGENNQINEGQDVSIGGGVGNVINIVSGPFARTISSNIVGGDRNVITESHYSMIGGGRYNEIIGGVHASGHNLASQNTILIGENNKIEYASLSSILGGNNNTIKGYDATEWNNLGSQMQGIMNLPSNSGNPLFYNNAILGDWNSIQGSSSSYTIGQGNTTTGSTNTVIGYGNNILGSINRVFGDGINILQGTQNHGIGAVQRIQGSNNVSIGHQISLSGDSNYTFGENNSSEGYFSMTMGYNAHTIGYGIGIINLDRSLAITGSQDGSFIINAPSNVGINTTTPNEALDVNGNIKTQGTFVAPSGNYGITQTISLLDGQSQPCTLTVEAGIITATSCATLGQPQQPLIFVSQAANPSKNLFMSALRFTITNQSINDSNITNLYFDTLLQGYTGTATIEIYRNSVSVSNLVGSTSINTVGTDTQIVVPIGNQIIDAQNTISFIVVVNGIAVDPYSQTQYREISLTGVDFDNVGPGQVSGNFPISENY